MSERRPFIAYVGGKEVSRNFTLVAAQAIANIRCAGSTALTKVVNDQTGEEWVRHPEHGWTPVSRKRASVPTEGRPRGSEVAAPRPARPTSSAPSESAETPSPRYWWMD